MSNLFSTLHVGSTGLRTSSSLMHATGQNVANANTEGYSRRSGRVVNADPVRRYGHQFGEGAKLDGFTRHADVLIDERLMRSIGEESRSRTGYQTLYPIESYFSADVPNGPAGALDDFFDSLTELTTDPSDRTLRETVLSSADRLTESVQRTAQALQDRIDGIVDELDATMASVNDKLEAIARLNNRVAEASGSFGEGDFQDQRDGIIRELAESIGVVAEFSGDGQATLMLGGHAVVQGGTARELSLTTDASGSPQVNLSTGTGGGTLSVTDELSGEFGGLLEANDAVEAYAADLDTWVDTFGAAMNTQHNAGFDSAGVAGGDFFSFTAGAEAITFAVDTTLLADPTLLATAGAVTAAAGDGDNLDLMLDIESQSLHTGATRTTGQALSDIYASVGRDLENMELDQQTFFLELDDLRALRDSVSSVDLDEEAADLLAYQASYQASARMISATNELLDTLIGMGR
jgi:flagellar hook-associated protein 1